MNSPQTSPSKMAEGQHNTAAHPGRHGSQRESQEQDSNEQAGQILSPRARPTTRRTEGQKESNTTPSPGGDKTPPAETSQRPQTGKNRTTGRRAEEEQRQDRSRTTPFATRRKKLHKPSSIPRRTSTRDHSTTLVLAVSSLAKHKDHARLTFGQARLRPAPYECGLGSPLFFVSHQSKCSE